VDNATALQFTQALDAQMDKGVFNLVVDNFFIFYRESIVSIFPEINNVPARVLVRPNKTELLEHGATTHPLASE